jgi:DNA-directed RNA polymerase subunit RPC12/RpoP
MKSAQIKETNCPTCKHKLNAAADIIDSEHVEPQEGDVGLCNYCGEVIIYKGGELTAASPEFMLLMEKYNPELHRNIMLTKEVIKLDGNSTEV